MTDPDPIDTIILELKPVTDPLAAHGRPARDPAYRLKLALKRLLRDHGFRAVRVMASKSLKGPPCPRCQSALDDLRRCWRCADWVCGCGAMTGSPLISTCLNCQAEGLADE